MRRRPAALVTFLLPAAAALGQTPPAPSPQVDPRTPYGYLAKMLRDAKTANPTLAALRSTGDKDLAPLFAAMTRSGEKKRRMFGVLAVADLVGKDAADVLLERVNADPAMAIRAVALSRLVDLEALSAAQLAQALRVPDENVQCLAARALVGCGQAEIAQPHLVRLAGSKDVTTSSLASMCLLGLGRRDREPALRKVVRDPNTDAKLLGLLLRQVETQKITSAIPLALHVAAAPGTPTALRVQAYRTVSNISSLGAVTLRDTIARSTNMALRVRLLKMLAVRPDAGPHLKMLTAGATPVAVLARFELARRTGGATASSAVVTAVALGHPVVIAYVLDRAAKDIEAHGPKAGYYVPALLRIIRSVDPHPVRMRKEHYLAAGAATRLLELGTPAALAGLKELLAGKATAVTQATAAGLLRATNVAACDLVRPLLSRPYEELANDAALALGHFGDPGATARLTRILAGQETHPPTLVVLSSWYLLKIAKQTQPAATHLAKLIQ